MIALTDHAKDVVEAIRKAGGEAIEVTVGCEGVRIEKPSVGPKRI